MKKKIAINSKAQTQQVFIYIMVILVVGAVLLFGFKSIGKIMNQSCDVDEATFQTQLRQMLERNNGYGDKSFKPIKTACGYETLCFVDSNTSDEIVDKTQLKEQQYSIYQEVAAQTGNNVFLIKGSTTKALYDLDYLVVQGNTTSKGFVCIHEVGGQFYIALEGLGKGQVKVSSQ